MPSIYTLADLRAAVYARLEDNTIFFTLPEVDTIINEAIKVTNLLCGFAQATSTLISNAGQLVYPVPSTLLFPERIQFEGQQLDPVPITRIGQDYRTWTTDTTAKLGPVARWIPIGCNLFCLHPTDAIGGNKIFITGIVEPSVMVAPTDAMNLPDQYATLVVEYSASRLPLKLGGANWQAAALLFQKSFLSAVKPLIRYRKTVLPRFFVNAGAPVAEGQGS